MLNQVDIEGFVTKSIWQYASDTYFRLAVYRDPDRERKGADKGGSGHDKADYVTVRVPAELTASGLEFTPKQRIQVHGWLESREFDQTLAEFLEKAGGPEVKVAKKKCEEITAHRTSTWIVAERIVTLNGGRKSS